MEKRTRGFAGVMMGSIAVKTRGAGGSGASGIVLAGPWRGDDGRCGPSF